MKTTTKKPERPFQTNVRKGIAFLNRNGPTNWRSRIDIDRLDIEDTVNCILGQVYGDYMAATNEPGLGDPGQRAALGFTVDRYDIERLPELTGEWKRQLKRKPRKTANKRKLALA